MDEDGYNDSNRAFLQAFMARSTMTFDEAKPVLAAIFSAHGKFFFLHLLGNSLSDSSQKDEKSFKKTSPRPTSTRTSLPLTLPYHRSISKSAASNDRPPSTATGRARARLSTRW
jgi:hypothetical protein